MEKSTPRPSRFAQLVGDKLRRLRQQAGFSLQDVCDRADGAFVVSTLSAYEHGKRSLNLERVVELADIYGVSPMTLLDVEEPDEPALARVKPLRINLQNIQNLAPSERLPLEQYLAFLKRLRNDPAQVVLTIRKDDLTYLATLYGVRPEALKDRLRKSGIID
ncbi:MAG: helix-turn-helix domain-containing protein [Actinobacteria bacterium]|nr:helix-turn-helix domain-containing protein [Actinomycetota bacterium]